MSTVLTTILIATNVLLATGVFVILARPEAGAKWVFGVLDPKKAAWDLEPSDEEHAQHERMASVLGWIGLAVLGGWSFAIGSYLALIKM